MGGTGRGQAGEAHQIFYRVRIEGKEGDTGRHLGAGFGAAASYRLKGVDDGLDSLPRGLVVL
jgi:hypothetical protein